MNFDGIAWLNDLAASSQKNTHEQMRIQNLQQLRSLLKDLGFQEKGKSILHIAGSKGKGSTSAFLANTLQALGYSVLLFTSPHVFHITERLQLNTKPVDQKIWNTLLGRIYQTGVHHLGYFDTLTALAFIMHQELKADYLVLETGIGGRLDATNICAPKAAIVTPIELEHTQILGPTLAHIAREKAGIIKPNIPVFCGPQPRQALQVLQSRAAEKQAPFFYLSEYGKARICAYDCRDDQYYQKCHFSLGDDSWDLPMKMMGNKQAENALLALLCLVHILPQTEKNILLQAWGHSLWNTYLPGRFEIINSHPLRVLDGCHTPESMKQTVHTWKELVGTQGVLIFTCNPDKNIAGMMPYFKDFAQIIITGNTEYIKKTAQKIQKQYPRAIYLCQEEIYPYIKKHAYQLPILAAGSFYSLWLMKTYLSTS